MHSRLGRKKRIGLRSSDDALQSYVAITLQSCDSFYQQVTSKLRFNFQYIIYCKSSLFIVWQTTSKFRLFRLLDMRTAVQQ